MRSRHHILHLLPLTPDILSKQTGSGCLPNAAQPCLKKVTSQMPPFIRHLFRLESFIVVTSDRDRQRGGKNNMRMQQKG